METIHVVAAIIGKLFEDKSYVLAARRAKGRYKGQWEFPGGKVENGETSEQALIREIKEELAGEAVVVSPATTLETEINDYAYRIDYFWCTSPTVQFTLNGESDELKWVSKDELYSLNWMETDKEILDVVYNAMR